MLPTEGSCNRKSNGRKSTTLQGTPATTAKDQKKDKTLQKIRKKKERQVHTVCAPFTEVATEKECCNSCNRKSPTATEKSRATAATEKVLHLQQNEPVRENKRRLVGLAAQGLIN